MRVATCIILLCLAPSSMLAATAETQQGPGMTDANKSVTRIALITDTHVSGPQLVLDDEPNPLDNLSVLKTPERLWGVVNKINAVVPPAHMAVVLGDFVHGAYYTQDYKTLAHGPTNAYHITRGIVERLNASLYMAFGNHDFQVVCKKKQSVAQELTTKVYKHFFDADPYTAVETNTGWKLLVMNSMLGRTWRAGCHGCNTRLSTYGREQLDWAACQLAEGKPTVVVMHHPLPTSLMNEEPEAQYPDIVTLLSAFDNVKLVLSGHYHKGYDWQDLYPFPARTLPALRYTDDNFFLLDLKSDGSLSMPDWDKNKGGSRCSQSYEYQPNGAITPSEEPAANTEGDCGVPLGEDTFRYTLPPINSRDDIPADFNPELSCAFTLSMQMLAPCLRRHVLHPTEGCCSILTTQYQHGSDRPFDGCLCQPTFWRATNAAFAAEGLNLTSFIEDCAPYARGAPIFYRGDGACPAAPANEVGSELISSLKSRQTGMWGWVKGRAQSVFGWGGME